MAKCVACTAINSAREAKKHPNFHTEFTAKALKRRWETTPHRFKNKYCLRHDNAGTGRATTQEGQSEDKD